MTDQLDPAWLFDYWPAYVAGALLLFALPEAIGIIKPGRGGTLSERTRAWLKVEDLRPSARYWIFLAVWVALAVWFPLHLLKRWWWEKRESA